MKLPIKYKLASIIIIIFVPLIVYAFHHYYDMVERDKKHIQSDNLEIASVIAKELDEIISDSLRVLSVLSEHPAVTSLNSRESNRLFARLLASYPDHSNIVAADMKGNTYGTAALLPSARQVSYAGTDWFAAARKGLQFVGNFHVSRLSGSPGVMIAVPVSLHDGRQIAVLGAPLDLTHIRERFLGSWSLPEKSAITIIDSKGNILIDTLHEEKTGDNISSKAVVQRALGTAAGSLEGTCGDEITRLHSFTSLRSAGWKVIVGVPIGKAYHYAYQMHKEYLIMVLVLGFTALLVSAWMSRKMALNVSTLVTGLREVGKGNLSHKLKLPDRDELHDVAASFDQMALERKESETFLASVLDGIGEGVVVVDREFRILSANKSYCAQSKMACEDIIGRHCYEISHHIDEPCYNQDNGCDCTVQKAFEDGEHHRAIHTHYDKDGKPSYIETNAYPLKDDSGTVISTIETLTDITAQRSLEAQLFQSQKMESVGLLAGGVAHDFNNILTAIIGYGNLALARMEKDHPSAHSIEQILASSDRAAQLTQSLLAFSRKQILDPVPVLVGDVVRRIEKLLSRIIGETIELRILLSPDEAAVKVDVSQLEQVLMNLCTNARDAMSDGGTLMIETDLVEFDDEYIEKHAFAKPGNYMLISVTDSGLGMDKETREKIFEPFFTTKEIGKGTGLGLSIIYGIIKQHNGYLNVYSESGKGTTFRIYLPIVEKEATKLVISALPPVIGGTETILLAEDDAVVRDMSSNILEEYGYRVLLAEDGEDAVEKFMAHPGSIDLLILDVVMPKKTGKGVYDEAVRISPAVKALFMSGYTQNMIHKEGTLDRGIELITKPFSPNAFLRKVREVLDK